MAPQWNAPRSDVSQAVLQERERIAQDIHDDLGGRLTQLMLLGSFAQGESLDLARARELLAAMAHRSRELAGVLDEIIWTVNPRNDSLAHLADYVSSRAREFFEGTNIRCCLDLSMDLPDLALDTSSRHQLFLAVKEALHNAAKHSEATTIWVRLQVENQCLSVSVEDNGRGFDAAEACRAGCDGLENMRVRLARIGGSGEVWSQPGCGCKVRLRLPLNRN